MDNNTYYIQKTPRNFDILHDLGYAKSGCSKSLAMAYNFKTIAYNTRRGVYWFLNSNRYMQQPYRSQDILKICRYKILYSS